MTDRELAELTETLVLMRKGKTTEAHDIIVALIRDTGGELPAPPAWVAERDAEAAKVPA